MKLQGKDQWNITVNHKGALDAVREFDKQLDVQGVPVALGRRLRRAAVEMTTGAGENEIAIISSGHHRDDGTGYFALSVSVAPPKVERDSLRGRLAHVQV